MEIKKCKYVVMVLVFALVFLTAQVSLAESEKTEENELDNVGESEIEILVDDEKIDLLDQNPYINEDGRVQVPVRFVTKALGAEVKWNADEEKVTIEKDDNNLSLQIGSSKYTLNGEEVEMDTAPKIVGGNRTVVPLRFISEELVEKVDWNGEERIVNIYSEIDESSAKKQISGEKIEEDIEEISDKKALITASALNVRNDPGIDQPKVGRVYDGEVYQTLDKHIIEKEDVDYKEWLLIELSGDKSTSGDTEGWISLDYVEIVDSGTEKDAAGIDIDERDVKGDGNFIWPVDTSQGYVSSNYGPRGSGFHSGVDYIAPHGTTIRAADDGVVEFSDRKSQYGKLIIIDHSNGFKTYYAHNYSNDVSEGETVEKGQAIGEIGGTGNATGAHLHFEVHVDGSHVDPLTYVRP